MNTLNFSTYSNNFYKGLDEKCNFWQIRKSEHNKDLRIDRFNELLLEINNNEESYLKPYLRVTLCYKFIVENVYMHENGETLGYKYTIDYTELAYYFTTVFDDIEYIAANDQNLFSQSYSNIFTLFKPSIIYCIVHALVECCTKDVLLKYIDGVVNIYCNENKTHTKAKYFDCVIREYAIKEDYQSMVDYGKWIIDIFENSMIYSSSSSSTCDFISLVESIHNELDRAFKALGISDANHEIMMNKIGENDDKKAKEEAEKRVKESLFSNIKDISNEKERSAKFKESLRIIKNNYPKVETQFRVKLCYCYAKALYKKSKESYTTDHKELAGYLSTVMNDIEYIAANDTVYYADYQDIYRINKRDFISYIIEAIVVYLPQEYMQRFMHSVVTIRYNNKELYNLVNYFRCVIQKYTKIKRYQVVVDYAKWFTQLYKEKESGCTAIGVYDFQVTVDAIHIDIDEAYQALKIDDAEHEKIMVEVRKRLAETPQERQNREKAELYDQAQRCLVAGDEEGYRGYMSVLGDIGR